jgi:hypothetical protein
VRDVRYVCLALRDHRSRARRARQRRNVTQGVINGCISLRARLRRNFKTARAERVGNARTASNDRSPVRSWESRGECEPRTCHLRATVGATRIHP